MNVITCDVSLAAVDNGCVAGAVNTGTLTFSAPVCAVGFDFTSAPPEAAVFLPLFPMFSFLSTVMAFFVSISSKHQTKHADVLRKKNKALKIKNFHLASRIHYIIFFCLLTQQTYDN